MLSYRTISSLAKTDDRPTLLSIIPSYSDYNVGDHTVMSEPLPAMFNDKYAGLKWEELLCECDDAFQKISVTREQAQKIESATRRQARLKEWFQFRAGCITASCFKVSVHTNPKLPSKSLIKAICYPETVTFTSKATKWGCEHEKTARETYISALLITTQIWLYLTEVQLSTLTVLT